jgi:hypothetical protein
MLNAARISDRVAAFKPPGKRRLTVEAQSLPAGRQGSEVRNRKSIRWDYMDRGYGEFSFSQCSLPTVGSVPLLSAG